MPDPLYKVISILTGIGIFAAVSRLVAWAIRLEPRIEHIERETAAHGALIQQMGESQARVEGFLSALAERYTDSSIVAKIKAALKKETS